MSQEKLTQYVVEKVFRVKRSKVVHEDESCARDNPAREQGVTRMDRETALAWGFRIHADCRRSRE